MADEVMELVEQSEEHLADFLRVTGCVAAAAKRVSLEGRANGVDVEGGGKGSTGPSVSTASALQHCGEPVALAPAESGITLSGNLSGVAGGSQASGISAGGSMDAGVGTGSDMLAAEIRTRAFLSRYPKGRQTAAQGYAGVPAVHLWMRLKDPAGFGLPGAIVGTLGLRIGNSREIKLYAGHIGYNVLPAARGNHFSERAVRLLEPLAREYGIRPAIVTCNPDNMPSRRTLERLGAKLVDVVAIPARHPFYLAGERQKCRYVLWGS